MVNTTHTGVPRLGQRGQAWASTGKPRFGAPALAQVRPAEHWPCLWFPSLGPRLASLSSDIQWLLNSGLRQASRALAMPAVSQPRPKTGEPKFGHLMAAQLGAKTGQPSIGHASGFPPSLQDWRA